MKKCKPISKFLLREIEKGLSREEAQRAIRMRFDGPEQVTHKVRHSRTVASAEAVFQDLLFAWRNLKKRLGYALTAIGTLALGIGANTVISALSAVCSCVLCLSHIPIVWFN
ncbi:MAG: hypothetical protein M3Y57_11820 [Acidobacteriota bacterium]|nr:hypothetical protein [Acidobacteriota bacterium]